MTGGQKAPTTLPGTITDTTPYGADSHFIHGPQLLRNVNPTAWIARGITTRQLELRGLMKQALEFTMAGKGFAFLEVLSPCTLNWGTMEHADETFDILERKLAKAYQLGKY